MHTLCMRTLRILECAYNTYRRTLRILEDVTNLYTAYTAYSGGYDNSYEEYILDDMYNP